MKKSIWLFFLAFLNLNLQAQQMVPVWINSLGGPKWDMANAMVGTSKGEVVIAGTFSDSIKIGKSSYFSKGLTDVYSAKYSESGELIGAFTFGGPKSDFAQLAVYDNYLVMVSKFYGPFELQGRKIDSTGVVNYLVGWFGDDGTIIHTQTISSPGELIISSLETDHRGTVYLTGWYTQALQVGAQVFESAEGKNTFVVTLKDNGQQISVLKPEKDTTSQYYCSILGQNNLLHVAGTTTAPVDSTKGEDAERCNSLFITSFVQGAKQDSDYIVERN
jgi:hypothetical protein